MRPTSNRESPRWVCLIVAVAAATLAMPVPVRGQIRDVSVGFQGLYKVGHWTPVWVTLEAAADADLQGQLVLSTSDGDGNQVRYQHQEDPVTVAAGQTLRVLSKVKFGRLAGGLTVELLGAEGPTARRALGPSELPSPQLSDSSITLTLGRSVGVQDLLERSSTRGSVSLGCQLTAAEDLPDDWVAYESVDTIVVATRDNQLLESLSPDKWSALRSWVVMGGRLLLSVGSRGGEICAAASDSPLRRWAEFVPGDFVAMTVFRDSAALETYSGSPRQLVGDKPPDDLQLTVVRDVVGSVELSDAGVWGMQPIVVRAPFGFGDVVFVAFDLDHPAVAGWEGRPPLLARLLRAEAADNDSGRQARGGGRVAHVGFTDLAGQLRSALDEFADVSFVPFFWVAGLVFVYVALIGPGDFFFVQRVLKKMQWTWLTFPLVVGAFSLLAIYLFANLKGSQLRVNQVDLVDIDMATGTLRGSTWADIYSPQTELYDLRWQANDSSPSLAIDFQSVAAWEGLPGTGLGGMNTPGSAPAFTEPYRIIFREGSSRIHGTPIQVSATRVFQVRWWAATQLEHPGALTVGRNQLLTGEVVNPLPFELEECAVLFGDWLYRLDSKYGTLGPGEGVRVEQEQPLNLEWKLTRRRVEEAREVNTPWDQQSVDVPRILEMMMFHEMAGGESYTRLANRYHAFVDFSHLLRRGRAVLMGRSRQRPTDLQIGDQSADVNYDQTWCYYRIVLPVLGQQTE